MTDQTYLMQVLQYQVRGRRNAGIYAAITEQPHPTSDFATPICNTSLEEKLPFLPFQSVG